jgi:hypothetical protein
MLLVPPFVVVTLTVTAQEAPGVVIVPPDRLTLLEPGVATAVPPQVLDSPLFGDVTAMPAGNVSLKAIPISAVELADGLVIVMVSVDVSPGCVFAAGLNALVNVGAVTTAMLAEAVPPMPPSVEVTLPVTLFWVPGIVLATLTEKVHDPLAASDAPERLITFVFGVAVIVPPPQLPDRPLLGLVITSPAGNVSLNPIPVIVFDEFGLVIVKLSEVAAPSGMLAAPNALLIVGGVSTVTDAADVLPVP